MADKIDNSDKPHDSNVVLDLGRAMIEDVNLKSSFYHNLHTHMVRTLDATKICCEHMNRLDKLVELPPDDPRCANAGYVFDVVEKLVCQLNDASIRDYNVRVNDTDDVIRIINKTIETIAAKFPNAQKTMLNCPLTGYLPSLSSSNDLTSTCLEFPNTNDELSDEQKQQHMEISNNLDAKKYKDAWESEVLLDLETVPLNMSFLCEKWKLTALLRYFSICRPDNPQNKQGEIHMTMFVCRLHGISNANTLCICSYTRRGCMGDSDFDLFWQDKIDEETKSAFNKWVEKRKAKYHFGGFY